MLQDDFLSDQGNKTGCGKMAALCVSRGVAGEHNQEKPSLQEKNKETTTFSIGNKPYKNTVCIDLIQASTSKIPNSLSFVLQE